MNVVPGDELDFFLAKCLEMIAPHASYDDDDRAAYEKLERVRRERLALRGQLERTSDALRALQYRRSRWFRWVYPLDIIWRKPWRSTATTGWHEGRTLTVKVSNFVGWLRFAHDCADASIACSCHPSYRFPNPEKDK